MKKVLLICISSCFLFFTSCNNLPSESTAETDSQAIFIEKYKDTILLIEFSKTNAMEKDATLYGGGKCYVIEFKGKIKFLVDAYFEKNRYSENKLFFYEFEKPVKLYDWQSDVNFEKSITKINKNEIKEIEGTIAYVKKENGWEVVKNMKGKNFIDVKLVEK